MHGEDEDGNAITTPSELSELTRSTISAAIEVHRHLGPGLLESTYETCLTCEPGQRILTYERQKALPLVYKEIHLDQRCRIDLLVEGEVIAEIKFVDQSMPVHEAQVLSYLPLSLCRIGLSFNFNAELLKDGTRRFVM